MMISDEKIASHKKDEKSLLALKALKDELNLSFKWGNYKLPIALGIHRDVFAHYENDLRFSKKNLRKAIAMYTSSRVYLENLLEGNPRFNILGKEEGYVTKEEAEHARALLLKRKNHAKKSFR